MDDKDPIEEFENNLRQAFLRRPAPPGLKRRVLLARSRQRTARHHSRMAWGQRLAACFVGAAVLSGVLTWRHIDQQRKGEAARDQVITALRITNRALTQIQQRLAARDRDSQE